MFICLFIIFGTNKMSQIGIQVMENAHYMLFEI